MTNSAPQVRFCRSRDGTRIAYARSGSGPPLLWSPHLVLNLRFERDSPVWRPWIAAIGSRYSVYCYDWRGCGFSDREPVDFSFDRHVEDLEAVIGAAKLEQFSYLGMANGAAVGMAYAARHPRRIRRLVLYSSWFMGRLTRRPPMEAIETSERLPTGRLGLTSDNLAYKDLFVLLHKPEASDAQVHLYQEQLRSVVSPINFHEISNAFSRIDLTKVLPHIACPTLVLHSRSDTTVPFDQGRGVATLIPGARFVSFESHCEVLAEREPAWMQFKSELNLFLSTARNRGAALLQDAVLSLTPREEQVLELVTQGRNDATIGRLLEIREKTVRNKLSSIFKKLGVRSRAQAVTRARAAGYGKAPLD